MRSNGFRRARGVTLVLGLILGVLLWRAGRLYVANQGANEVRRYDGASGTYLDSPVAPGSGGVSGPLFACFVPRPGLRILAPVPGVAGAPSWLATSGATPGAALLVSAGRARLLRPLPGCSRIFLPPTELAVARIGDESGGALVRWTAPLDLVGRRVYLRVVEPASCRASAIVPFDFL